MQKMNAGYIISSWFELIESMASYQSIYPDILQEQLNKIKDLAAGYKNDVGKIIY